MLNEKTIQSLTNLVDYLEKNKHRLVIDGDTHPTNLSSLEGPILERYQSTDHYYQGRPIGQDGLLDSMAAAGVDMSLIWQNPAAFSYTEDKEYNFKRLLRANRDIAEFAQAHPTKFIPAGWTDPKSLGTDKAIELVEICVKELGFPIVKMNPAQNAFPIDSDFVFKVIEKIAELGATTAFHFGGDTPYTPPKGLGRVVSAFPKNLFIGVHMGGGGSHYVEGDQTYLEARDLGLEHTNLFYVLSAKRDCHIASDLVLYTKKGKPYNENIGWGSDAPYGMQSWNLGGYHKLFESFRQLGDGASLFTDKVVQNYLGTNVANLVIRSCRNVLEANSVLKE